MSTFPPLGMPLRPPTPIPTHTRGSTASFQPLYMSFKFAVSYAIVNVCILIPHVIMLVFGYNLPCDQKLEIFVLVLCIYMGLIGIPEMPIKYCFQSRILLQENTHPFTRRFQRSFPDVLLYSYALFTDILKYFIFIWYIVGNAWIWKTETCRDSNPYLYWLVFADMIISYIIIIVPVFLLVIILVFYRHRLPTVDDTTTIDQIILNEAMNYLPVTRGLSPSELNSLRTFSYDGKPIPPLTTMNSTDTIIVEERQENEYNVETTEKIDESDATRKSNERESTQIDVPNLSSTDYTTCAICVAEYEKGETLRELACSHLFHQNCVDEWLSAKEDGFGGHRTCPLCVRDAVTGELINSVTVNSANSRIFSRTRSPEVRDRLQQRPLISSFSTHSRVSSSQSQTRGIPSSQNSINQSSEARPNGIQLRDLRME